MHRKKNTFKWDFSYVGENLLVEMFMLVFSKQKSLYLLPTEDS